MALIMVGGRASVNSVPQRSLTECFLRELQAWARQIIRIESILLVRFPCYSVSAYIVDMVDSV
jgi:hypothetical protein